MEESNLYGSSPYPRFRVWLPTIQRHLPILVGAEGFEPSISWSQARRVSRLRYAPMDLVDRQGFEP